MRNVRFDPGFLTFDQAQALNKMADMLRRLEPGNVRTAPPLNLSDLPSGLDFWIDTTAIDDLTVNGIFVLNGTTITPLTVTDDTTTVTGVNDLTFVGATVTGTTGSATVTITAAGASAGVNGDVQFGDGAGGFKVLDNFLMTGGSLFQFDGTNLRLFTDTSTAGFHVFIGGGAGSFFEVYHSGIAEPALHIGGGTCSFGLVGGTTHIGGTTSLGTTTVEDEYVTINTGVQLVVNSPSVELNATTFGAFTQYSSPVAQPTAAGLTAGFTPNASANTVFNESTWTGNTGASAYTVSDIVKALKDLGWLAV